MSFWKNLPARNKLASAFGLLILAVSVAAVQFLQDDVDFTGDVQGVEARAAAAHEMRLAVDRRAIAARNLLLVTKPEDAAFEKTAVLAAAEDVRKSLDALQALSNQAGVPMDVRARVEAIASVELQYARVAQAILGLVAVGDRDAAIARMNERCRPLLAALVKATDDCIRHTAETSRHLAAENDAVRAERMRLLSAGCALLVVLSLFAAAAASSLKSQALGLLRAVGAFKMAH